MHIVGILNLDPSSFAHSQEDFSEKSLLQTMEALISDGAHVIDIGAESTRPGAIPLEPLAEWERLQNFLPQAERLRAGTTVRLSLDTYHPETAERALALGIDWINDVSGLASPAMQRLIATHPVSVVVMHHCGIPADPARTIPANANLIETLIGWITTKVTTLRDSGIALEKIIWDPGIGFGKTAHQSWQILGATAELKARVPHPLLIGHSRKSFLKLCTQAQATDRDFETCILSTTLALQGVDYVRVHNVRDHRRLQAVLQMLGT